MNAIDAAPLTTIAAVHGVTFGGGFELALACDLIIADKMARFCFPELRLGLIPGFGGIPRLKRDLGNASRARFAADRPQHQCDEGAVGRAREPGGGEGDALRVARATAAQIAKFDRETAMAAKRFIKPIPHGGAAPGDRNFLRAVHAACGGGGPAQVRRKHGCAALSCREVSGGVTAQNRSSVGSRTSRRGKSSHWQMKFPENWQDTSL